jgi:hypothetical protein
MYYGLDVVIDALSSKERDGGNIMIIGRITNAGDFIQSKEK